MKSKVPGFNLGNKGDKIKVLFLAQASLMIVVTVYLYLARWRLMERQYRPVISIDVVLVALMILSCLVGINFVYLSGKIDNLIEKEKEYEMQALRIEQMEEANDLLRSQKHDFSNNLQVLWGLLSLGDIVKAKEYLSRYSDTLKIDEKEALKLSRLSCTYLYTLLMNKAYKCRDMGIKINYYIQPSIPLEKFSPIDTVRVLGNLLDNAIYEVEKLETGNGCIIVSMYYDDKKCSFQVTNRGTVIPDEIRDMVFDKGFTTKDSEGSGFGLYNIKRIVKKYNGNIYIKSDALIGTSFIVNLPRI